MKSVIKGRSQIAGTISINRKRMDTALAQEHIQVPSGLTHEEKREYILKHSGKNNADDTSGRK
jgi:hypothetical protein